MLQSLEDLTKSQPVASRYDTRVSMDPLKQDKEHRRSALIQSLRKQQKEQDLLIDVLKQTLVDKVPEFQESIEKVRGCFDRHLSSSPFAFIRLSLCPQVNEFIIKKTVGGPKRFRPKTREELETELDLLDKKYKRAVVQLKRAKEDVKPASSSDARSRAAQSKAGSSDEDQEDDHVSVSRRRNSPQIESPGPFSEKLSPHVASMVVCSLQFFISDPALLEELEKLQVVAASREVTISSLAAEVEALTMELENLHL